MTKEARPLTQEQRKEFVQLLKEAKTRILGKFQDTVYKRRTKERDAARESLLKRIGAADFVAKVGEAKKTIKQSEEALDKLGVRILSAGVGFFGDHEDDYETEISEKADAVLDDQKEQARKTYEIAILNVLATENVEEAKGIVEPLV
jgi:GGDEF domain-containing protein